jgi:predicted transcriptional regulator
MRSITISLPDQLASALDREARRRSLPTSAIAQDALNEYLGIGHAGDRRELPFAALGHSGHHTTADGMEALLEREWTPDVGGL